MKFEGALKAMKSGSKAKLPSWGGYWYWSPEKETIQLIQKYPRNHEKSQHVAPCNCRSNYRSASPVCFSNCRYHIPFTFLVACIVAIWIICNEIISILENIKDMGVTIPQAYACTDRLKNRCVDPRYTYVNRGCAKYVEYLGIQENPKGQGWASGRNYGQKIINILKSILSIKTEKENDNMNINTSLISNNNSYTGQAPTYIVIHNTDNYAKGANAKAHAKAQHDGNFKGYSAHVYVDDAEVYQALPYNRGAWHVGVNYGGRLFGTVNNRNSVGIEMCVQAGYNYEKAFQNTVQVCKQIMKQLGIPADRVVQHYDVCAKNCPSAIRAKGDWNRFKQLIGAETTTPTIDKYYRTRKSWDDSKSQIGAYKSLENAKKEWKQGYTIYDWNGKAVYPVQTSEKKEVVLTGRFETQLPIIRKGNSGVAVSMLQSVLGVTIDGRFGDDTEVSLKVFQKNTGVKVSGTCGIDTWKKVIEHMKANTK